MVYNITMVTCLLCSQPIKSRVTNLGYMLYAHEGCYILEQRRETRIEQQLLAKRKPYPKLTPDNILDIISELPIYK